MPIFISYSREDSAFVDRLARNFVMRRHNVWMDRWEMNIGDSLIDKIQNAITEYRSDLWPPNGARKS